MLLYLLRHAEAVDHADSDASRELTAKGVTQARKVGKFCARHQLIPELILSSPLRRAEQTARFAAEEFNFKNVEIAPFLSSGMDPEKGSAELGGYSKLHSLMIVGHEPDFSRLTAHLLGLPSNENIHFRKASLVMLNVVKFSPAAARLEFALPVKLI